MMRTTLSAPALQSRRLAVLGIFLLALLTRLALVMLTGSYHDLERSELERVALAVAHGEGFANPFLVPTGPTAHVAPLYPLLLALVFKTFGTGVLGELVKQGLSCTVTALQYALLPLAAGPFGLRFRDGVLAGCLGALLPIKLHTELSGDWEAPYAALAFIGISLLVLHDWKQRRFSRLPAIRQGICWGGLFLLAPMFMPVFVALAIVGCWCFRSKLRNFVTHAMVTALLAALMVTPWLVRNYQRFGCFVPIRDNFGLEFYLSNNAKAHLLITDNFRGSADDSIHPTFSLKQANEVRSLGETVYNARRLKGGLDAVRDDPARFLRMTAARTVWFWIPWSDTPARDIVSGILSVGALFGLGLYLKRRTLPVCFTFAVLMSFPLVYYVLECSTRYRYPIDWLLLLASAHALFWIYTRAARQATRRGIGPKLGWGNENS